MLYGGARADQYIGTDHDEYHAGYSTNHAGDFASRKPLVSGEEMGGNDGEERRGGVEDGGQTTGDARLAPREEAKGNRVIECPHQQHSAPMAAQRGKSKTRYQDHDVQCDRGER